jgi:hypothetical protein
MKKLIEVPEGKNVVGLSVSGHSYVRLLDSNGNETFRFDSPGEHITAVVRPGTYTIETDGKLGKIDVISLNFPEPMNSGVMSRQNTSKNTVFPDGEIPFRLASRSSNDPGFPLCLANRVDHYPLENEMTALQNGQPLASLRNVLYDMHVKRRVCSQTTCSGHDVSLWSDCVRL